MLKFEEIDLDRMVEEVLAGKEIARETAAAIVEHITGKPADAKAINAAIAKSKT